MRLFWNQQTQDKEVQEDKSPEERAMALIVETTKSMVPDILFTMDLPSRYECKMVLMLHAQVWTEEILFPKGRGTIILHT